MPVAAPVTLYEGARLISGDGSAPIESSAFIVTGGTLTSLGASGAIAVPPDARRVDLRGQTVMPTLIGAHGHVGFQRGNSFALANYTRDNIYDDLRRATYFGLGAIMTLGIDRGDLIYAIRAETADGRAELAELKTGGRGIGGPNTGPGNPIYARGVAYEVVTMTAALAAVDELARLSPDFIKIWLDPRDGRGQKLPADVAVGIIEEARRRGLDVISHVHEHEDAERVVAAGVYGLAHLVQDREIEDALVAEIVARGVYVTPTLSMAERNGYAGQVPQWFEEPGLTALLRATVSLEAYAALRHAFESRSPEAAERGRANYAILRTNVAKLHAAGARIVLGADTGLMNHLWGYAEQRELELLVEAGLTPMDAIVAGTSRAAAFLKLDRRGTLRVGNDASFLVLDGDPLTDIRNTRRIARMFLRGREIDRAALARRLRADDRVHARLR